VFDVSFVELMVIGIVALVVLGPERLPGAARTVGGFVRRARASWQSVRAEIERELAAAELEREMASVRRSVDAAKTSVDAATAPFDAPPAPTAATDATAPDERRDG
jgi:sec-independent protein translocase protein TatB